MQNIEMNTYMRATLLPIAIIAIGIGCDKADDTHNKTDNTELNTLNKEVKQPHHLSGYDSAVVVAKKAIEIAERTYGPDHPNVATSLNNLASFYQDQGQYAEAEPLFKRSLAIREKALGPDHPSVAVSLKKLAVLYRATKREKEAEKLEQRAARIRAIKR